MIGFLAQNGSTSTGGGLTTLLVPLALMGGLFYFMLIRPQKRRAQAQRQLLSSLEVGDEIMTGGGIFGTIKEIDDDEDTVTVEIAPGIDIRMVRRSIAQKLVEDEDFEDEEEADQSS
ncbi:MAG: preprotein translocase subunit YajC [Actinobacteria bacterium]|nr:preprotein translocase subunit YajC [Actinomycetota bacterium]